MNQFLLFAIIIELIVTNYCEEIFEHVAQDEISFEGEILVLTDDNFDRALKEHSPILVEFYAPWCGHCKKLEPLYAQAALMVKQKGLKARLAKLDVTLHKTVAAKFEVQGYPTLKLFLSGDKNAKALDYDGERNPEGILEWLAEKMDPNYKAPESAVLTLTTSNFSKVVDSAEMILVELYAPWCGHCKKLAPEFEKAAKRLANLPNPILLAKVDATVETELKTKFDVKSFPTLKLFKHGTMFDFDGPREADGIVEYLVLRSKPAYREIKSVAEVNNVISKDDITIVAFLDDIKHESLLVAFKEACEATREEFHNTYYTSDNKVVNKLKGQMGRIGIYYPEKFWSKYEPKSVFYGKTESTKDEILQFFFDKCKPLVGQRTFTNQAKHFTKRPLVVAYFTVDFGYLAKDETQFWRQKILNVAHEFPAYYFAVSDEEEYAQELADAGLGESGLEINIIVFGNGIRRYIMDPYTYDEFEEDNLREFLKNVDSGHVKPFIKSQPLPKKQKAGSVIDLVGSNVEKVVNDESKDVLIELYAPWCGHCKTLAPIYDQLAAELKSEKNMIVAKMDATMNDVPEQFEMQGFPTIYLSPAGKGNPLRYQGGRTLKDMQEFLNNNAAASFKKETKTEL